MLLDSFWDGLRIKWSKWLQSACSEKATAAINFTIAYDVQACAGKTFPPLNRVGEKEAPDEERKKCISLANPGNLDTPRSALQRTGP